MKKKLLFIVLILSLGLNLGVFLRVASHLFNKRNDAGRNCMEYQWHRSSLKKDLNLNEEQTKKIQDYQKQMETQSATIKNSLNQERKELLALIKNGNLSESLIDKHLSEISNYQGQLEKKVIQHIINIKTVLTPEQLRKFNYSFEQGLCPKSMKEMPCRGYMRNKCSD